MSITKQMRTVKRFCEAGLHGHTRIVRQLKSEAKAGISSAWPCCWNTTLSFDIAGQGLVSHLAGAKAEIEPSWSLSVKLWALGWRFRSRSTHRYEHENEKHLSHLWSPTVTSVYRKVDRRVLEFRSTSTGSFFHAEISETRTRRLWIPWSNFKRMLHACVLLNGLSKATLCWGEVALIQRCEPITEMCQKNYLPLMQEDVHSFVKPIHSTSFGCKCKHTWNCKRKTKWKTRKHAFALFHCMKWNAIDFIIRRKVVCKWEIHVKENSKPRAQATTIFCWIQPAGCRLEDLHQLDN